MCNASELVTITVTYNLGWAPTPYEQPMTSPTAEPVVAPPAPKPASLWEDFVDIFYAPSAVYERRQNQNPWPMIFMVTALMTLVTVLTFNALGPVIETEMRQAAAKAMAKTPQMTQDQMDLGIKWQLFARRWGGVFFPIGVFIGALFVWIVARVVGAKETYGGAMVVVTYSSILAILQAVIIGAQALVMDVSTLTTPDQLSLSAARFADKATMSPAIYTVLKQLDLFGIWSLVVMAIGVRVTAKTTKERAIAFGVVWWVFATAIMVLIAVRQAAAA